MRISTSTLCLAQAATSVGGTPELSRQVTPEMIEAVRGLFALGYRHDPRVVDEHVEGLVARGHLLRELADGREAREIQRLGGDRGARMAGRDVRYRGGGRRLRAGNLVSHTERACEMICGTSTLEAAGATDAALTNLPRDGPEPAFEVWRRRIQHEFATVRR